MIFADQKVSKIFISTIIFSFFLIIFTSEGTGDVSYFVNLIEELNNKPLSQCFEETSLGYFPLFHLILFTFCIPIMKLGVNSFYAYKITILIFTVFSNLIFLNLSSDRSLRSLFLIGSFYFTIVLGYSDILYIPFILFSLICLNKKEIGTSLFLIALASFIKPTPWILSFPMTIFIIFYGVYERKWKKLATAAVSAIVLCGVFFAIFHKGFEKSLGIVFSHSVLSANALNLNWIIQSIVYYLKHPNDISVVFNYKLFSFSEDIGHLTKYLFFICYFSSIFWGLYISLVKKRYQFSFYMFFMSYFIYMMISVGVHENHGIVLWIICAFLAAQDARNKWLFAGVTLTLCLNLFLFYGIGGSISLERSILKIDLTVIVSLINTIFFLYQFFAYFKLDDKRTQNV